MQSCPSNMEFGHRNRSNLGLDLRGSLPEPARRDTEQSRNVVSDVSQELDEPSHRALLSLASIKDSRLPLKESLGLGGCVSLFGGGIGILAVLGFLTFLWFGHGSDIEGRNATKTWRSIVLSDWMTRTITLTALVLRLIVSAQAILCTSMTAALILEKRSAPKSNVAHLSVIRGTNGGALQLIQLILTSPKLALWP
jgi:hypothetical protein